MTITVRGPGGVTINFPDGTDAATIDQVMRQATAATDNERPELQTALNAKAAAFRSDQGMAAPKGDPLGPVADANAPPQSPRGSFMDPLVQGLTVGFGDEIVGGIGGLASMVQGKGFGAGYDEIRGRALENLESQRLNNPVGSTLAELGGAVVGSRFAPAIQGLRSLGVLGRVGEGVAMGTGYGAAYGAGSADGDIAERGRGAASGGMIGAVSGLAGATAVEGVSGLARGIGSRIGATIRGAFNPETEAARRVAVAGAADNAMPPQPRLTPQDEATAALNNQPVLNIDRGGETTRALARSAANTSPEGRSVLTTAVSDRFESQSQRTADTVRRIVGGNTTTDSRETLIQQARTANRPAYARAYAAGDRPVSSPELERLMSSPDVVQAMKTASQTGKGRAVADGLGGFNAGVAVSQDGRVLFQKGPNGVPTYPNIQFWDYTHRALKDAADAASRAGKNSEAAYLGDTARALRGELDRLVPEFGQARAGAARFFGAQDALEAGDQFVMSRMANNEARQAVAMMSPAERQLFAEGFADSLVRRVQETGDRRNVVNSIFGSPAARERVRIALGPQRADEMEAFLRVETLMDRARTAVTGNSTTARQLAELTLAGGAGLAISGGNIMDPRFMITAALVRGSRAGARAIDSRVAQRVATMLASPDPAVVQRGVQMIARSDRLFAALRSADVPVAAGAAQEGVRNFSPSYAGRPTAPALQR